MFEGQEALSKEDKAAGAKARLTVAQAEAHIRKRLVVLRWQYAMAAVLMKLAGHEDPGNRLTLSQTEDPFVDQVHLRNAVAADSRRIQNDPYVGWWISRACRTHTRPDMRCHAAAACSGGDSGGGGVCKCRQEVHECIWASQWPEQGRQQHARRCFCQHN